MLCCGGARGRVGLLPLLLARTECDVGIVLALLQTQTYLSTSSSFGIVDKTPFDFLSSSLCMLSPCVCALGEVGDQIMHEKEEKSTLTDKTKLLLHILQPFELHGILSGLIRTVLF